MAEVQQSQSAPSPLTWVRLSILTILSSAAFIFMEWLFTITKPSFMRTLGFAKQLEILFFAAAFLSVFCLFLLLIFFAISRISPLNRYISTLHKLAAAIPAIVLASLLLLVLDNFTYTLFQFGIVSTTGLLRAVYAVVFLALLVLCYCYVLKGGAVLSARLEEAVPPKTIWVSIAVLCLVPLLLPFLLGEYAFMAPQSTSAEAGSGRPNILLITSDGISATRVSTYEYELETTPNLTQLAQDSMLVENAFANSGNTTGSVTAFLTGKYPSETRVLYMPDILTGMDAYEHLPGILQRYGYTTIQYGHSYYLDAYTINFLDAFESVNGKTGSSGLQTLLRKFIPNDYAYFINLSAARLSERLQHIFFIKKMHNPYDLVTEYPDPVADSEKFYQLYTMLQSSDEPVFVHLHAMGTHGPYFSLKTQKFSAGISLKDQPRWDDRFYDDSILEFDSYIADLIYKLKEMGEYDNTILVVASDHPQLYVMSQRIPLLIHFPEDQYAGTIHNNVQSIDLAPTLLDYLGIEVPEWMDGYSLLEGEPDQRYIFGVGVGNNITSEENRWFIDQAKVEPPFYQFQMITLEYCQNYYEYNLDTHAMTSGLIGGTTASCPEDELPDTDEALQLMADHLEAHGFDVSSLR